ncbi:MAG: FecR domain-containing protein [Acidobacteriaceae bacterium]|nr:FecR domain-containing protein [Acidobacteriaceae bacterium]
MNRTWPAIAKILTGFFVTAMYAMPQAYTISAKPGVVNYVEGNAFLNGRQISTQNLKATFLNANDTISTDLGKAEVLLAPGVFLRIGDNSQVRMVSPSLSDTQIELKAGEAMIEADDIVKDTRVSVIDAGNTVVVERSGLYKFSVGDAPKVAVLEGKLDVYNGDRKTEVGKGHEFLLGQAHKAEKFDTKRDDNLYAWSNVRSQYNAASSYQAAKDVNASGYGGVWGDFGFGGYANPGWMWNSGFNSWAWLPGGGAYYSPFGYGFYGPGVVGYAPVIYAPVYGGGGGYYTGNQKRPVATQSVASTPAAKVAAIPVNPAHPAPVGMVVASPFAHSIASSQTLQSHSSSGFRTASGMTVPAGRAAASNGIQAGPAVSRGGFSGVSSNGVSAAHAATGMSGASAGGHSGGAASGGAAHR